VRKKPKLEDGTTTSNSSAPPQTPTSQQPPHPQPLQSPYEIPSTPGLAWHNPMPPNTSGTAPTSRQAGPTNHEDIASADLQNPSDALEILAQVADRAEDGESVEEGNQRKLLRPAPGRHDLNPQKMDTQLYYKPVQDGMMTPEMVYNLFSRYVPCRL
jgi:hypothetical protein